MQYFSDRENGAVAQVVETILPQVWAGLKALIDGKIRDGSLGYGCPLECPDGDAKLCGCDESVFSAKLRAEIPAVDWYSAVNVETMDALDILEFCFNNIGEPIKGGYHNYFDHYHLKWDHPSGAQKFVEDVNVILRRNGLAFQMGFDGRIIRVIAKPFAAQLESFAYSTGESETDRLLQVACEKIRSPKDLDRRDALEKIWDAFERIKTLEEGRDKKAQTKALLDKTSGRPGQFRDALEREALELTSLGNNFRIRHSELPQEIQISLDNIDYLFFRMFSFLHLILKKTDRCG